MFLGKIYKDYVLSLPQVKNVLIEELIKLTKR